MLNRMAGKLLLFGIVITCFALVLPFIFGGIGLMIKFAFYGVFTLVAAASAYAIYTEKPGRRIASC